VADCLRHYPAQTAVPIADAALHQRLTDPAAVRAVLGRQALWPYAARAEESWRLVDGRRESWLESVSAVRLWRVGIEPGEPQVEILDAEGRFLARVDFLWPEEATVGEADGQAKYVATGKPALLAEKKREDALRDIGLEVVRWGTAEVISAPEAVARRIRRARARGSRTRFAGSWRFMPAI
jgi:hypothetical protein